MLLDCSKMWICEYKFPIVSFYHLSGGMRLCFTTLQGTVSSNSWEYSSSSNKQAWLHNSRKPRASTSQNHPQEKSFYHLLKKGFKESPGYPKEQGALKFLSEILRKITFKKDQKVIWIQPTHISSTLRSTSWIHSHLTIQVFKFVIQAKLLVKLN